MHEPPLPGDPASLLPRTLKLTRSSQDRLYRGTVRGFAVGAFVLLFLIGLFLLLKSLPAIDKEGWGHFLTSTGWTTSGPPPSFGILSALYWTAVIAVIALVIGIPV